MFYRRGHVCWKPDTATRCTPRPKTTTTRSARSAYREIKVSFFLPNNVKIEQESTVLKAPTNRRSEPVHRKIVKQVVTDNALQESDIYDICAFFGGTEMYSVSWPVTRSEHSIIMSCKEFGTSATNTK